MGSHGRVMGANGGCNFVGIVKSTIYKGTGVPTERRVKKLSQLSRLELLEAQTRGGGRRRRTGVSSVMY